MVLNFDRARARALIAAMLLNSLRAKVRVLVVVPYSSSTNIVILQWFGTKIIKHIFDKYDVCLLRISKNALLACSNKGEIYQNRISLIEVYY